MFDTREIMGGKILPGTQSTWVGWIESLDSNMVPLSPPVVIPENTTSSNT